MGGVLGATREGPGLSPDSRGYFMAAEHLEAGRGLTIVDGDGRVVPLTHFPPLYPILLRGVDAIVPGDLRQAASTLGATLFAANIAVIGLLAWRASGGSAAATLGAAAVAAAAVDLILAHSMVWSEGTFLLSTFLCVYFVAAFNRGDQLRTLVAAALASAVASSTRYAGEAVLLCGAALLLVRRDRPLPRRLRDALLFAAIGGAPLLCWLARNALLTGDADGRAFAWHPPTRGDVRTLLLTFAGWMVPTAGAESRRALVALASFGALVAAGCVTLLSSRRMRGEVRNLAGTELRRALVWFLLVYAAFVLFSVTFVDAHVPLDARILSPVHVGLVVLLGPMACGIGRQVRSVAGRRLLVAAAILFVAGQTLRAARWVQDAPERHLV